jgi:nicotinamidase-related amidase
MGIGKNFVIIFLASLALSANASQNSPSEDVCDSSGKKSALVIIDMQAYFAERMGYHKNPANSAKLEKINEAQVDSIKKAIKAHLPIIFIEYDSYGDTNKTLKKAVGNYSQVKYIKKNSDGMLDSYNKFRSDLVNHLKTQNVKTLIITGANGGACVDASIRGALKGNCDVVSVSTAVADFNYKDFIYPYSGHYENVKPNCTNCSFREVASIDEVSKIMIESSGEPPKTASKPTSKKTSGSR